MTNAIPTLFNQQILRKRLERTLRKNGADNFLLQRVGEDMIMRISTVKRDFEQCAIFGDPLGAMAKTLQALPNLDKITSISLLQNPENTSQTPQIIGTEELLPLANGSLNLAISPLTLQHLNDLPGALIQLKRSLKPDGLFIGAFLGGDTLTELRDALLSAEMDIRGGAAPRIHPRVDIRDLGGLLQRAGFTLPVVDADRFTVTYRSVTHLMHDLRDLGLTNNLTEGLGISLTRDIIARLEDIYKTRYPAAKDRIAATFEIIYLTGWSPHESQQQPLKPGSAKTRLADALQTQEFILPED